MSSKSKKKFAMYWAGACGGCEISLLNADTAFLSLTEYFDIVFCPCLVDGKKRDVEKLDDGAIDLTFFNGALRTEENCEMARLLRAKSRLLVAYGSCALEGCIPGLANLLSREELLEGVNGRIPVSLAVADGDLPARPELTGSIRPLDQIVPVDYRIPGCPPEGHQVEAVIAALLDEENMPPHGTVLGAGERALCEECPRFRSGRRISRIYRSHEIIPDPQQCLLEQGLLCMGPATRGGCRARCPKQHMCCIGCYGPPPGVTDQGAAMIAALGSILDVHPSGKSALQLKMAALDLFSGVVDPVGTFYRFSLAASLLGGGNRNRIEEQQP